MYRLLINGHLFKHYALPLPAIMDAEELIMIWRELGQPLPAMKVVDGEGSIVWEYPLTDSSAVLK